MIEEADYVICGGGSAGCAMAARLSEDPDKRVVLLEAGSDNERFWIRTPAGLHQVTADPEANWMYMTEPDASQKDRRVFWSSGRGLGGGSAINGMVYIRGTTYDYDHWSKELGCTGWSWDEVLPYFKKSEDYDGPDSPAHGKGGPLGVSRLRALHPLAHSFIDACKEVGMREIPDYCEGDIDGAFINLATQRNGQRCSTAEGFLKPAMNRRNLQVITGATADRILFEGKRAVGVRFLRGGQSYDIKVNGEVILASGTIQTPALLMRSGVGPGAHLQDKGIDVIAAREQVGRNMHEHPSLHNARLVDVATYNVRNNPFRLGWEGIKYIVAKRGWLTTAAVHAMAHVRSDPELQHPDIKYQLMPFWADHNLKAYHRDRTDLPDASKQFGVAISVNLMTPDSRGRILLKDANPMSRPLIDFRIYEDERDLVRMRKGMKLANAIFEAPSMAKHVTGTCWPLDPHQSDDAWDDQLRSCSSTGLHPVGSCRMGSDPDAVVDTQLRVNGVERVRLADCSIIPLLPSANTNAPAIMIGERCADFVRGNRR